MAAANIFRFLQETVNGETPAAIKRENQKHPNLMNAEAEESIPSRCSIDRDPVSILKKRDHSSTE
jgi:hypothetical protein